MNNLRHNVWPEEDPEPLDMSPLDVPAPVYELPDGRTIELKTGEEILAYYNIDPSEVTPYYMDWLAQLYYFNRLMEQRDA